MLEKPACSKSFGYFYSKFVKCLNNLDFYKCNLQFNVNFSSQYYQTIERFTFNFSNFDLGLQILGPNNIVCFL